MPRDPLSIATILGFTGVLLLVLVYSIINNVVIFPFFLVVATMGTVFFMFYPRISIMLLLAGRLVLDLFHWIPFRIGPLNLLSAFTGGATVLCLILIFRYLKGHISRHECFKELVVWIVLIMVAIPRASNTGIALNETFRALSPVLFLFLISTLLNRVGDAERLLKVVVLTGMIPMTVSLYHWQSGQMSDISLHGLQRLLGGYKNLRHHALIMMILSGTGLYYALTAKKFGWKAFWYGYTGLAGTFMFLTQIRTCVIVTVVYLAIFCWLTGRRQMLIVGFLLGLLVVASSEVLQNRFSDLILIFTLSSETDSAQLGRIGSGRYGMWTKSWEAYSQYPIHERLIGLGFGQHYELIKASFFAFDEGSDRILDTHNDSLRTLYNMGPIAFYVYLSMALKCILTGLNLAKEAHTKNRRELASVVTCLMIGLLLNNTLSNGTLSRTTIGWVFWAYGGLLFAMKREEKQLVSRKQQQESNVRSA